MIRGTLVAALLLASPLTLTAQQPTFTVGMPELPVETQRPKGEKSPALAGLLSWLVWPGVGSYYAGNRAHGYRHVLIGVAAVGAVIPLLVTCDNDGFCDFDHDGVRLSVLIGLTAVWVANSAWSIIAAVNDAEDHNYSIRSGPVSLTPSVKRLATTLPDGRSSSRLGLLIVNVTF